MSDLSILVVGYYGHHNLGDEQYKTTIQYILKQVLSDQENHVANPAIDYIDCDRLAEYDVPPNTIILLGGGDVLNTYFLDKLNQKFPPEDITKYNYRVIAFSVGIPYNDIFILPEQNRKLQIFDAIFLRTRQDIPVFSKYFPPERLHYLPDTSCFVLDALRSSSKKNKNIIKTDNTAYYTSYQKVVRATQIHKKIVGISLCRHIYHPDAPYRDNYRKIVRDLALMIYQLVKDGYYIVLVPFNTKPVISDPDLNKECDLLIQADVLKILSDTVRPYVLNLDFELTLEETMNLYELFHVMIPMRFHATLFSVYAGIPMIPIYTTKKIRNFLLDIDWKYEYVLEKNEKDLPIRFDRKRFLARLTELTKPWNYADAKETLFKAQCTFKQQSMASLPVIWRAMTKEKMERSVDFDRFITKEKMERSVDFDRFITTVSTKDAINKPIQSIDTVYKISENNKMNMVEITDDIPQSSLVPNTTIQRLANKLQEFAHDHRVRDFRDIQDPSLKNIAVCVVSWYLTGTIDSSYHHGLLEKMFTPTYHYEKEWTWVIQDWKSKNQGNDVNVSTRHLPIVCDVSFAPFNIDYIDQNDRSGAHRSGWKYVYQYIQSYRSTDTSTPSLLLDLYVDRTFHWKRDIFKYIGIVPYTQPWMGVVHHTFDTTFSEYNNEALMKCPEFLESLDHCRGILVLSKTLQAQFRARLPPTVPVFALTHPTELNVPKFDYRAFLDNSDKQLLHVGGWLRNIFSFYQLELSQDKYFFKEEKAIVPVPDYLPNIQQKTVPSTKSWYQALCCRGNATDVIPPPTPDSPIVISSPNPLLVYTSPVGSRLRKVVLKGKYMDNYFPSNTSNISDITPEEVESTLSPKMCSNASNTQNNWYRHLSDYVKTIQNQVDVLDYMDNAAYDDILTKNLVFLHLVDGSAINTLIECIVRTCPIFVNRHPAVVELLGEAYPLYYTIDDTHPIPNVDALLKDTGVILRAHQYLVKLDKTPFMIETFLKDLSNIMSTRT